MLSLQQVTLSEQGKKIRKIKARLLQVPTIIQPNDYSCGTACTLSLLLYYGFRYTTEEVLERLLKTTKKEGTSVKNIVTFFKKRTFTVDARIMNINDIETFIEKKIPVLVIIQAWSKRKVDYTKTNKEGHYVIVVGYNKDYLFFNDPVLPTISYLSKKEFISRWHYCDATGNSYPHYGIAISGKKITYDPLVINKIP